MNDEPLTYEIIHNWISSIRYPHFLAVMNKLGYIYEVERWVNLSKPLNFRTVDLWEAIKKDPNRDEVRVLMLMEQL